MIIGLDVGGTHTDIVLVGENGLEGQIKVSTDTSALSQIHRSEQSDFLPIILFGLLIALTMINTTIGSILRVPSAIRRTNIDLNRLSRFLKRVVPARLAESLTPPDP